MDWKGGSDCDSDTEAGIDWVDDADFEATSDVLQSSELQPMVTASDLFWGDLERRPTAPRNARFYVEHAAYPVYPGCRLSLQTVAMKFLLDMVNMKRDTANNQCRNIRDLLPVPNIFPPSIHILKKVEGIQSALKYAQHVCPDDCIVWDWVPPALWKDHVNDQCTCGQYRFQRDGRCRGDPPTSMASQSNETSMEGSVRCLRPSKVFFDFGVADSIRSLFLDPEYRRNRGKNRSASVRNPSTIFGCKEGLRLTAATRGMFAHADNSPYDLGFDFGQFYKFKNHSFGVIMMRPADLPPDMICKQKFCRHLILIPGNSEPKSIDVYLMRVIREFQKYGPEPLLDASCHAQGPPGLPIESDPSLTNGHHVIFLARVYADTPAREKLTKGMGHSSYHPCWWCSFKGTRVTCKGLKQGNIEDMNAFEFEEANDDDDDDGLQVQSAHESMSYRGVEMTMAWISSQAQVKMSKVSSNTLDIVSHSPNTSLGAVMSICWLGIQD